MSWQHLNNANVTTLTVLQMIDSLAPGGAERMAVNISNALSKDEFQVILCATRRGGELENSISPNVDFFYLSRRSRFDLIAVFHLIKEIKRSKVDIIHAHSTSLFLGVLAKYFVPKVKIVWHDHYGAFTLNERPHLIYRFLARHVDGVLVVNHSLAQWARETLKVRTEKVWFLPNFVEVKPVQPASDLPGQRGNRIVCVANLRPQKDHLTLICAMKNVIEREPKAHLLLVGANNVPGVFEDITGEIRKLGLENNITWMGSRNDVNDILTNCDIGVLSSLSEGLPLSILEYGIHRLPVVCTNVGECPNILDNGLGGLLVKPGDSTGMADAILELLRNKILRDRLGTTLYRKVSSSYSEENVISRLKDIYRSLMDSNA